MRYLRNIHVSGLGFLLVVLLALFLLGGVVLAQSGEGYDLNWYTVGGGGSTSLSNGGYTLSGTVGQADAVELLGGDYTLVGGFWGGEVSEYSIYLPLVLRR